MFVSDCEYLLQQKCRSRVISQLSVERPRLVALLKSLLGCDKNIFIQTESGFGCSTFLAQYFKDDLLSTIWVRVDKNDNYETFKKYFQLSVMQKIKTMQSLKIFDCTSNKPAIVIEDLHKMDAESATRLIRDLCNLTQGKFNLIFTSNFAPEDIKRIIPASFSVIKSADLLFAENEIKKFAEEQLDYQKVNLEALSLVLFEISGGWPIALQGLIQTIRCSKTLDECVNSIASSIDDIKACYDEEIDVNSTSLFCSNMTVEHSFLSLANCPQYLKLETIRNLLEQCFEPLDKEKSEQVKEEDASVPLLDKDVKHNLLSKRELVILQNLADGKSVKNIAEISFSSEQTVRTHIKHIYKKLQTHSKKETILKAIELGII